MSDAAKLAVSVGAACPLEEWPCPLEASNLALLCSILNFHALAQVDADTRRPVCCRKPNTARILVNQPPSDVLGRCNYKRMYYVVTRWLPRRGSVHAAAMEKY